MWNFRFNFQWLILGMWSSSYNNYCCELTANNYFFSVYFCLSINLNYIKRHKTTKMSWALKLKHALFNQAQIVYFLVSLLSLAYTYIVVKFPPEMVSLILFMLNIFLVEKRKCLRWMNYGNDWLLLRSVSIIVWNHGCDWLLVQKSLTTHTSHLLSVWASVNK